jgi:proteasome lid subunit RPN8/RPN11
MPDEIRIGTKILEEMLGHARREPEIECCGLLAGRRGIITAIFPAQNALASATAYEIAPRELFRLFKRIREEGLEHLGIYHSHPAGENEPSPTDVRQAYYPGHAYFIISPQKHASNPIRAFSIREGTFRECAIVVLFP